MQTYEEALAAFDGAYIENISEILVVTGNQPAGASRGGGTKLWIAAISFLAYVDCGSAALVRGEGQVVWPIGEKNTLDCLQRLQPQCIYRLRVRVLRDKNVPAGRLASFYNSFLLVEILEEHAQSTQLLEVLEEYLKPVVLEDEVLGRFELNQDLELFHGCIPWGGRRISASLQVDVHDKASWEQALDSLREMFLRQAELDAGWRRYAAEALTGLANEWAAQENAPRALTAEEFAKRISLLDLGVTTDGSFSAYYDDDGLFWGHAIEVDGNLSEGVKSATLAG